MKDPANLAWELVATLAYVTGRLYEGPPESAHRLLLEWLEESDDNVITANEWLRVVRSEGPSEASRRSMTEYALRVPLERALGLRSVRPTGRIVGVVRIWHPIKRWRTRRRMLP